MNIFPYESSEKLPYEELINKYGNKSGEEKSNSKKTKEENDYHKKNNDNPKQSPIDLSKSDNVFKDIVDIMTKVIADTNRSDYNTSDFLKYRSVSENGKYDYAWERSTNYVKYKGVTITIDVWYDMSGFNHLSKRPLKKNGEYIYRRVALMRAMDSDRGVTTPLIQITVPGSQEELFNQIVDQLLGKETLWEN